MTLRAISALLWLNLSFLTLAATIARAGELEIRAVDSETGEPLSVRMHVTNQRGRAQRIRGLPNWGGHFAFDGRTVLTLPPGEYTFVMERGPEYRVRSGYFTLERDATDNKTVEMFRFVDLADEGWYSGDLSIQRPPADIPVLLRAEDLHVGPLITWNNDQNHWADGLPADPLGTSDENRFYHLLAGADSRSGGLLRYFNLPEPLPVTDTSGELPSPFEFLKTAADLPGGHVDIGMAASWDMPTWVASGLCDSICLADEQLGREGTNSTSAALRPADRVLFPPPHGAGRWAEAIYYRLLNCGLRLPPTAGSGSGTTTNPAGYNRVYVYCGENFAHEAWWSGLKEGRVFVTNGPLLRVRVNGYYPGHVFRAQAGETLELDIAADLATRDPIEYLEIIRDGRLVEHVRLKDWANDGGHLPLLSFDQSGWFLVRAVTSVEDTYRFASTGPFYVEIDEEPRISRQSCQFFLDWVQERSELIAIEDPTQRESVLRYHRAAREAWQRRLDSANAD